MFIDILHNRFKLFFFEGEGGTGGGGNEKVTINSSVNDAAKQVLADMNAKVTDDKKVDDKKPDEKKAEDKKVDDKKDDKKDEDLNEEQLKYAKTLFRALSSPDPKIQKNTIELFAKAAGLELKEIETKKEVTEAKDQLVDLVKAELEEYDFLAPGLTKVIEKVVAKVIDEKVKDIREDQNKTKEDKIKTEINSGIDEAFDLYKNAEDVKTEVVKLIDEIKYTGKTSYKEYFNRLIRIAADEKGLVLVKLGETKKEEPNKDRIDRNRNDAQKKLASDRTAEAKEAASGSQRKGLDASVRDAVEQTLKKMNA